MLPAIAMMLGCHHVGSLGEDAGPDTDCAQGEYSGSFSIHKQSNVATLAGYTSISGDLTIFCPSCTDLDELICLTSVGEHLGIYANHALTNLDGLSALTSIGEGLRIGGFGSGNPALTNLDGLNNITSVGDEFVIFYNTVLPDCESCDLLDQITSTTGLTVVVVHDNLDDMCTPVPAGCP